MNKVSPLPTPTYKKALVDAEKLARSQGCSYIDSGHLLAALMDSGQLPVTRLLTRADMWPEKTRGRIMAAQKSLWQEKRPESEILIEALGELRSIYSIWPPFKNKKS